MREILIMIPIFMILIIFVEFVLRIYYAHSQKRHYVWLPYMLKIYNPTIGILPGIRKQVRFRIGREGLRGDDLPEGETYRILAIGGSTTACCHIGQNFSWPYALQNRLNKLHSLAVWVGNAAKPGLCTRERIMHLRYLLPQLPKPDMIIMLSGCVDLARRLIEDENYDPHFLANYDNWEEKLIKGAFASYPNKRFRFKSGYYRETAIMHYIDQFRDRYLVHDSRYKQKMEGRIVFLRNNRKNAVEIINEMPDLTSALTEYWQNLNQIINIARANSIRIVFITQPTIWKTNMPPQENDILTLGNICSIKSKRYYSSGVLSQGMKKYNTLLSEVCKRRQVECIDLAAVLPKDMTVFYDDCHFNENGSLMAAYFISNYLSKAMPFAESADIKAIQEHSANIGNPHFTSNQKIINS